MRVLGIRGLYLRYRLNGQSSQLLLGHGVGLPHPVLTTGPSGDAVSLSAGGAVVSNAEDPEVAVPTVPSGGAAGTTASEISVWAACDANCGGVPGSGGLDMREAAAPSANTSPNVIANGASSFFTPVTSSSDFGPSNTLDEEGPA